MWNYENISRNEFEKIKDHVEEIMVAHGARLQDIELPYTQKTTAIDQNSDETFWNNQRKAYKYKDLYYRIGEVCFQNKPFIVAEVGTYDELMKNIMEDCDPFPWDLNEEAMEDEVSYFLGEKP